MKLQRYHFSPQLFKDPECWSGWSRSHDLPRHNPVHNQVSHRCAVSYRVKIHVFISRGPPTDTGKALRIPASHRVQNSVEEIKPNSGCAILELRPQFEAYSKSECYTFTAMWSTKKTKARAIPDFDETAPWNFA